MRLLRLADVGPDPRDRVFRYSTARALLFVVAVLCAAVALAAFGRWGRGGVVSCYLAAVGVLGVLLMRRFILARFRASNWLVRMRDDALLIQFRSYLNYQFPADDLTVVLLPFAEIRSARMVRETTTVFFDDERSQRRRRIVELELGGDAREIAQALAAERARRPPDAKRWFGKTSSVYRHYPVRMASATAMQIEWGVVPGAPVLLDALRRHTVIEAPVDVAEDFTRLTASSREEQQASLRKLIASGQTVTAIYTIRRLYGYDLAQAKAMVDDLSASATATSEPV